MLSDKAQGVLLSYDMKDEMISFPTTLIPAKTIFFYNFK